MCAISHRKCRFFVFDSVIASVIIELAWLKEEEERKNIDDLARLATCRCGTHRWSSYSNANSLFADENTRESLVGFIKACDYI